MKHLREYENSRVFDFYQFVTEAEGDSISEPVGLAVLGAPAGGKSHVMSKISSIANDARIERTLSKGVVLTVDKLRDEFLSKDPISQLKGFVKAFYLMKHKAKENEKEFGKWYFDIKKLWSEKFASLLPELKVTVEGGELLFDGKHALNSLKMLNDVDAKGLIDKLDKYNDYKRVVRYFQDLKQKDAVKKTLDVSYDEAGDEPTKIVNNMTKLHRKGYVTDVFLIHPENVASNLIQNFFRVVSGGDGGRDSSDSIIQAFKEIGKNKEEYTKNAEEVVKVKSKDIEQTAHALQQATVADDEEHGDKPIDVFVEVQPMTPEVAFKTFGEKFDKEKLQVFTALLRYAAYSLKDIPEDAKKSLLDITKSMSNKEALEVLKDAADSKKYVFKYGGVTPELVKKAQSVL